MPRYRLLLLLLLFLLISTVCGRGPSSKRKNGEDLVYDDPSQQLLQNGGIGIHFTEQFSGYYGEGNIPYEEVREASIAPFPVDSIIID